MTKLKNIIQTPTKNKEFKATFIKKDGSQKTVRFGTKSNFVLNKDKTEKDKKNYISRHKVNENFNDPLSSGSLSRHLLWGDSRNLQSNIKKFKTKFNL